MPKRRVGVALLLAPPWDGEVDGLRRALGDGSLGRIPAHLTLVPPVNVRDDRMDDALAVLRRAGAAARPLTVELGPPASFLPVNPVVYLAVTRRGREQVQRLRDAVFREPLERPLTFPFEPHVTLADEAGPGRIEAALAALGDYRVEVTFGSVHLLEEGPGRVWLPVAEAPLAAPAVVGRGGLELELSVTGGPVPVPGAGAGGRAALVVTARRDAVVVGTATGWTWGPLAELDDLTVAPAERRQGIGSHLLARFRSEAAHRHATTLRAHAEHDTPAEAFLTSRGARETARHPGTPPLLELTWRSD
ncbi:MAG TPA: GNAT family N-acetyltransferase [Acidimicrobiales bacterium]|nr:GNAT family N-acetyltransferase [Acidimicrobiales bacterium]